MANEKTYIDIDTIPTCKQDICFADNFNVAVESLNNNFHSIQGFDSARKLMLFGVDDWGKNYSAFSNAFDSNRFENLEFFGCEMNDSVSKALAEGLKRKGGAVVKSLEIDNSPLTAEGAKYILECVNEQNGVQHLNMQGSLKNGDSLKAVAKALAANSGIIEINLKINQIDKLGAEALSKMLIQNKVLCVLDLFYNNIGKEGAIYIANALRSNDTLRVIDLCCNKIGDEGAVEIGDALITNRGLEVLKLAMNDISNDGCCKLCDALNPVMEKKNDTINNVLKELDIAANLITTAGAKSIASLIIYSESLKMIDFTGIEPGPQGWEYFKDAFRERNFAHAHITSLVRFSVVDIDEECLEDVERTIDNNPYMEYKRKSKQDD